MDVHLRTEILKKTTVDDPENRECLGSSIFRDVASVNPEDHMVLCEDFTNFAASGRQLPRESGAWLGKTTAPEERMALTHDPCHWPPRSGDKQPWGQTHTQESIITSEANQVPTAELPVALPSAGPEELSAKAESSSILGQSGSSTRTVGGPRSGCWQVDQRPCQSVQLGPKTAVGVCPGQTTTLQFLSMAKQLEVEGIWKEA
jgi:hypothetical protein